MVSEDDVLRRLGDLEKQVTARIAEQEEQLRALRRLSLPDGRAALTATKAVRKVKRVPASLRRRTRAAQRDRRVRKERPKVSPSESARRDEIVDKYLDAQLGAPVRVDT